ncbi:hypothetical protein GCM10009525_83580 [Streptosporangium amethystogenes subsp. fukuiense]
MADYDFPADLLDAQRALDAVMRECEELANALPSWRAVHAGEAEPDPDGEERAGEGSPILNMRAPRRSSDGGALSSCLGSGRQVPGRAVRLTQPHVLAILGDGEPER